MKKLTIIAIACLGLQISTSVLANKEECNQDGIKMMNKNVLLQANTETIFYIENISTRDIWLDRARKSRGASAGFASQLQPHHWSNLAVGNNFALSCSSIANGKLTKLNCADVVSVCKIASPENKKIQGSYWVKENQIVRKMGY